MVDAAWPQAHLADFKPAPLTPQDVLLRHADVCEFDMHVAVWCIVMAENVHWTENFDTRRVHGHQDLRLLAKGFGVGRCLDHHDHDLAPRIARTGDIIFLTVDDPFAIFQHGGGRDILGI